MAQDSISVQFNHVGFTVPRDQLSGNNLRRVIRFFSEVFGFKEREKYTKDGEMLVMMAGGVDQFIVFFGHDAPTQANPPLDHFGMRVNSLSELKELASRARTYLATDDGLEFEDYSVSDMADVFPHRLHKFYVRLGTPFQLEVQYYERV